MSLPKLSSSCFVWDSLVPDRKHDNSSGTVRTPTTAEGEKCNAYGLNDYQEVKLRRTIIGKAVPSSACFFCHTHDRTCSGGSTSSPCSRQRGALLVQGKTCGKAHSILGNAASAKVNVGE